MISLFVSIVVPLIVLGLIVWVVGLLPIDAKIMTVIRAVAIILVVLWLLGFLFGAVPGYNAPTVAPVRLPRC